MIDMSWIEIYVIRVKEAPFIDEKTMIQVDGDYLNC